MTVEELAEAAVLDWRSFDPEDRLSDPHYILELLGSLVTVQAHKGPEEFVLLVHFSVKEFLMSTRIQRTSVSHFAINEPDAHCLVAESCLWYLQFCAQSATDSGLPAQGMEADYPLLTYVGEFCVQHPRLIP